MNFILVCILIGIFAGSASAINCSYTDSVYAWWNYRTWSTWGPWSSCDHTCSAGDRFRSRSCVFYNQNNPDPINGAVETEKGACSQFCLNNGVFSNSKCYCIPGVHGYCCEVKSTCRHACENNAYIFLHT
ncbi:properdin-like [Ruditapes philippinarum]|uniref:properdin-like n=1 Tax=Ruditapes philippinarum TaxID=129788 RepID=UPI00295BC931|nr:properdin-like [Ruditapes philippinarum]